MGRAETALVTADAIRRWQPRYVLLIGIAGGVSKGVELGDVLVAEQFVDYELQKITGTGAQVRYQSFRSDARLYGATQHLSGWKSSIREPRPIAGEPRCHFGVVLTGDKVQSAQDSLKPYLSDWPKLIGVEMEVGGAAAAAWEAPSKPGVLMVRGVSDLADENKGSSRIEMWRPYACDVAAAYAVALLRSGIVPLAQPR
jgi:nucleoside phosphorylase